MGSFSLIHWIILGVIILLLFGGNRFSAMMSDVAKGLKSFKKGMTEEETPPAAAPPQRITDERPLDPPAERSAAPRAEDRSDA